MKTIIANVARLSHLFTRQRENLPLAYLKDAGLMEAYVSYYLPVNIQKIWVPLQELSVHPAKLLSQEKLRILDLGCGPGTASLGIMEFLSKMSITPRLEFIAIDQAVENFRELDALFLARRNATRLKATMKTICFNIEDGTNLLEGHFDIIIFSNVLNELFAKHKEWFYRRTDLICNVLRRLLHEDGSCILIEPALRDTSRNLLFIRDALLCQGFQIYSPCFFMGKCPALINPKDWCHEDTTWEPSPLVREINKQTGLRKNSLKFSYLVLRKDRQSLRDACGDKALRVVSEPLMSKGKVEFYLCGPSGRHLITRFNKDGTLANQAFEQLQRGNIVSFEGLIKEEKRFKVSKETTVCRLSKNFR
ncbi:MAG TPA: small ribosomal subunit Rsm22 family protein [Nitrospirota bacterium]|nr:small ribosomal subunit Rsm22 family protein [Nitrospirota bacterium]